MVISAPVFVITNVAVPAFEVHTPLAVKTGGGGGGATAAAATQSDISATAVKPASLGLENV